MAHVRYYVLQHLTFFARDLTLFQPRIDFALLAPLNFFTFRHPSLGQLSYLFYNAYFSILGPDVLDEYYQQNAADKLLRASKENPAMPIGLSLGTGAFAYMMYSMKYSKQKLSVHLIHTRIAVQGSIVGVLTGMLLYQFYQ